MKLGKIWKPCFGKHNEIQAHQLENQLISLNPNDFSCIEDYLSKFKTLRLLLEECNIPKKDDQCIYVILAKLGSAYSIFVSTFHSTRESLGDAYKTPTLEYFCDSLIREKDKLLHLGVINTIGTSNKVLSGHNKRINPSILKKQHPHNNKQKRVPNPLS
jgi:hypothetical protein